MIGYIKGKVLFASEGTILLENNGIGYEVCCSNSAFVKLVNAGEGELFTYMAVREDGIFLYGFSSPEEKNMFLKLISVSGVGPKLGISVLSGMSGEDFATAIATADAKRLAGVKGLGKKTAEKISLELHGKISAGEIMQASGDTPATRTKQAVEKLTPFEEDALVALQGLGFTRTESLQAVKKAKEQGATTTEDIIMRALQGAL